MEICTATILGHNICHVGLWAIAIYFGVPFVLLFLFVVAIVIYYIINK
jgi:hypothetical protein